MTMPHLMNCRDDADGWCLDCVKELYDLKEKWKNRALKSCIQPYSYAPHSSGYICKYCNQFSHTKEVEHSPDCLTNEE